MRGSRPKIRYQRTEINSNLWKINHGQKLIANVFRTTDGYIAQSVRNKPFAVRDSLDEMQSFLEDTHYERAGRHD